MTKTHFLSNFDELNAIFHLENLQKSPNIKFPASDTSDPPTHSSLLHNLTPASIEKHVAGPLTIVTKSAPKVENYVVHYKTTSKKISKFYSTNKFIHYEIGKFTLKTNNSDSSKQNSFTKFNVSSDK